MYDDIPPLKVWAYTAVLVFSLLFLFVLYCYTGIGPYVKELNKGKAGLEAALFKNNSKDTSAVSVVVVGSSLLERALVNPREVEEAIAKQTQRPTNFLRVSIYYMTMDLAENLNLFESLTKYPPDYLLLENVGLNLDDPPGEALPTEVDAALLSLRNECRNIIGLPTHENYYNRWYTFDILPNPNSQFYTFDFDSATYKGYETKKMVVRKSSQNEIANKAFAALKGKTKIIFLGMPQAHKLVPDFLDSTATAEFDEVKKEYNRDYGVDYWQYSGVMPDSCFTDGFHLNVVGAKKYQDWFVSKFSSIN